MTPQMLRYYEAELQHLREMGGEFAQAFPKIAGRLGLEDFACADPYVERLLEGFSFLAARVRLRIDAEFPRFTNHLLELVYPHYLAPTPSMAVVQLQADLGAGNLARGYAVPRGTALHSLLGKADLTACEFRTAHEVKLWPLTLRQASYFACSGAVSGIDTTPWGSVKAVLRLRLATPPGLLCSEVGLERLPLYVRGAGGLPGRILEQLLAHGAVILAMPATPPASRPAWHEVLPASQIRAVGGEEHQALLPATARSFAGYRLLQEYFAFPERYLFVELGGLVTAMRRCCAPEIDLLVLLDRFDASLEQAISAANFSLYCTPAINLFPKRADRIHLSDRQRDYQVVPDRTRPLDFEVYQVKKVTGYGSGADAEQEFAPFYRSNDLRGNGQAAYFQPRREARLWSERQRRDGPRSNYVGSEVFLSLVDAAQAPYDSKLRQLGIDTLCTNRDLAQGLAIGGGKTDFTLDTGAPVHAVRCLTGPSAPLPSYAEGETAWRLVSHLSLNYLSLLDQDAQSGASALRELLRLYCPQAGSAAQQHIDGIVSVSAAPVTRRLPGRGPITYGRGLQITVVMDESAFEGSSAFVLGMVLEQFFAKYVTLNSFSETVLRSLSRGEIMRWPARGGRCEIL